MAGIVQSSYSYSDLMALWIANGGSSVWAPMAAAIAMAESGGNPRVISSTSDYGLWQINNGGTAMLDPNANAQRAIAMSNNGTTWRPWCTAYSDAYCGKKGGTYLGAGSPFMKFLNGAGQVPGTGGAIGNSPVTGDSGNTATLTSSKSDCAWNLSLPIVGSQCLFQASWGRAILGGLILLGGALFLAVGLTLLASEKMPAQIKEAASIGMKIGGMVAI